MPLSDGYFEDSRGQPVDRTPFEYIRDHLGYRIELQRARFPRTVRIGASVPVHVGLINRGFSVMHNPRPVLLVLINAQGKVVALSASAGDRRTWHPATPPADEHGFDTEIRAEGLTEPGSYLVGLWLPDASARLKMDPRYAVRVANCDVPWWTNAAGESGINLLGEIELQAESQTE